MAKKIKIDVEGVDNQKVEPKEKKKTVIKIEKLGDKPLNKADRQKVEEFIQSSLSKEREVLNLCLELDFEQLEVFLKRHHKELDFNRFQTRKGVGFVYTLLNRFKEEDFFVGDVTEKDILQMLNLLKKYGLAFNKDTCTAHRSEKHNIGDVFNTYAVNGFDLKSTKVAELIIEEGFLPNYVDQNGENPIFHASHLSLAELYLQHCIEIKDQINKYGQNALFKQVKHFRVLKMLIDLGLDYKIVDHRGDNLLIYGVSIGMPESLNHLLALGLDPNYVNPNNGLSVLFHSQHKKMLEILIKYKVNLEEENENGETIIFLLNHKDSIVKSLIKNKANINHQDKKGNTVLHYIKNEKLLDLFSNANFNFNIKNHEGDTVLDVYTKMNNNDLYAKYTPVIEHIKNLIEIQAKNQKVKERRIVEMDDEEEFG